MTIISGILYEEDFKEADRQLKVDIFTALKPLVTFSIATEIDGYINNPNADGELVGIIKDTIGGKVAMFKYAQTLRATGINTTVAEFNLFTVPSEFKDKGLLCGYPTEEGLKVIKDLLDHKKDIVARDEPPTKDEYLLFADRVEILGKAYKERLRKNKSRVYDFRSTGTSTYLGVIVRKLEMLEMAYKGVLYMKHLGSQGISMEGGSQF